MFEILWTRVHERLADRFHAYEVRTSLRQIASRWVFVLDESEKRRVSRTLGGNRYAKTTRALLDSIFEEVLSDADNS